MKRLFLLAGFILFATSSLAINLSNFKQQCESIGFKKGTEKFGDCVLKLVDRSKSYPAQTIQRHENTEKRRLQLERQRQEVELQAMKERAEMLRIQKEMSRIKGLEKSLDLMINGLR